MRKLPAIVSAAVLLSISATASAAVVYNNGTPPPSGSLGHEATIFVQAEDFLLASNATLDRAGIYIGGQQNSSGGISDWDGNVFWTIFASAPGQPGAVLASGGGFVGGAIDTGLTFAGPTQNSNIFLVEFDLNGFAATAGTIYWLGIHLSADFVLDEIYWVESGLVIGNSTGRQSLNGTFDNWTDNFSNHAFYLIDDDPLTAPVPEPSAWAMMLLGFGAAGFAIRRSRKTKPQESLA